MHLEGSHLRASELCFCRITSLICPTSKSVIRSIWTQASFVLSRSQMLHSTTFGVVDEQKPLGVSGIHLKQMNDKLLSRKNRECSSVAQSGVEILAHRSVSPFPIWFAARVKSFDLTKAFDHIRPSFAFTNLCYGNGSGLQVTHTTGRPN